MLMVADSQLKSVEKETEALINERNNKHRMIEITNYEYDRFSSHASIFKTIAFCSLFILGGVYINATWSNLKWLGNTIIILAIAVAAFLTLKRIWWNYWRTSRNWKQFDWEGPTDSDYETVWQHDKRAFEKGWRQAKEQARHVETDVKHQYGVAKKNVEKAYGEVSKDIKKASNQLTVKKKHSKHTESFAPFR